MLPPKLTRKLSEVPSEKTTETLFVSHAFHYLKKLYPALSFSIFAPSQTDEDPLGYDARFVGADFAFEVVLQFKKAELKDNGVFTLKPSHKKSNRSYGSQHEVLQRYPSRTAFYVSPTFKSYDELSKIHGLNSEQLLDRYVAVNVASLLPNTTRIRYKATEQGLPDDIHHLEKFQRHRTTELTYPQDWLKGSELFKHFIGGNILRPNTRPFNFAIMEAREIVGSLVRFGNAERPIRSFSPEELTENDYVKIINDMFDELDQPLSTPINNTLANIQHKTLENEEGYTGLGTSGIYILRVYNPFKS